MPPLKRAAFKATRLSETTYLITEHSDIYEEHPFIYIRFFHSFNTILVIDTGCGGVTEDEEIEITSLREFIEKGNPDTDDDHGDGKPLNEGGRLAYAVALTHCHYDHILGVKDFARDSPVYASGYAPEFISRENLPNHSLCRDLGIPTPRYNPTLVRHEGRIHEAPHNLVFLHTPGHTPDELAIWDESERRLFVGDTLYEWAPIIFPKEGSIIQWLQSVESLIRLVQPYPGAKICCGHTTADQPAMEVLHNARGFIWDVLSGKEVVRKRFEKRGEACVQFVQDGMRFSLICPERLVRDARAVNGK